MKHASPLAFVIVCIAWLGGGGVSHAGDLPRYKLQVGQKLVYGQSTHVSGPDRPAQDIALNLNVYVIGLNADGSWRVAEAPAERDGIPAGQAAVYDVRPDGRVEMISGEYDVGLARLFPRLPDDQRQLSAGWDDQTADHSRRVHLEAVPTTQAAGMLTLNAITTGGLGAILHLGGDCTYQIDLSRGLVISATPSKGAADATVTEGPTDLISADQLPAETLRTISDSASAYLESMDRYKTALNKDDAALTVAQADLTKTARHFASLASGNIAPRLESQNVNLMVPDPPPRTRMHQMEPEWSAMGFDGKRHSSREFLGKIVIMEFCARTCGFCLMEMPQLVRLSQDFKDKPVVVLGMNVDPDPRDAQAVLDAMKPPYLNIRAAGVWRDFPISISPITFIIDQYGMIQGCVPGYDSLGYEEIVAQVTPLLARLANSPPATRPVAAEIPDELKFLLAQNEQSFQKAAWVSYHSELSYDDTRRGHSQRTNDVVQKWPYRFVSSASVSLPPANQHVTYTSVLGADYFAWRMTGLGDDHAEAYSHDSIDQRSKRSIEFEGIAMGNDPLYTGGFGVQGAKLDDFIHRPIRPGAIWEVRENRDRGEHVYVARLLNPDAADASQILDEMTFAADQGYLVTHFAFYRLGKPLGEFETKIARIGPDRTPFPIEIDENRYTVQGAGQKTTTGVTKLSNIVLKPDIAPGEFTMAALGLREGEEVFYESTDTGQTLLEHWTGGKLMPDLSTRLHPAVLPIQSP